MKTNFLLTILVIALFTLTANSQITKGNWMVGGDVSFNNFQTVSNGYTNNTGSYEISPDLGYFLRDNLVLGSKIKVLFKTNGNNYFLLNPLLRYYFIKSNKRFNYFLEINVGYGIYQSKYYNSHSNTINYGMKPGIVVFLNQSVGIELSLDYSSTQFQDYKTNLLKFGFGLQIHLEKDK